MIVTPRGMGSEGSNVGAAVGTTIMASAPLAGPAAPVVVVVGALVALGSTIAGAIHVGEGCGPTCVQATELVNQIEPVMLANVKAYQANNYDQATGLNNYNQLWTTVLQGCGAIPGAAGANCVSDRQAGACKWKDANGECWNWDIGYKQPLLVSNGVENVGGSSVTSLFSDPMLLVGAGLLLVGLMVGDK